MQLTPVKSSKRTAKARAIFSITPFMSQLAFLRLGP
jgi:hypothetical protein